MPERYADIDAVDWQRLEPPWASPEDIPAALHAVWSLDSDMRRYGYEMLTAALATDGSRSAASAAAVPFLIDVVADPTVPDRSTACLLLRYLAIGHEEDWLNEVPDVTNERAEIDRLSALSEDQLNVERQMWIDAATDEDERTARERYALRNDFRDSIEARRRDMTSYDAVRAGVRAYASMLSADLPADRAAAAYLLAWFPEERTVFLPALRDMIADDSDPAVRATACVAAGLSAQDTEDEALMSVLNIRWEQSNDQVERWSAAIGIARVTESPGPHIRADLEEAADDGPDEVSSWPFFDGNLQAMAELTLERLSNR